MVSMFVESNINKIAAKTGAKASHIRKAVIAGLDESGSAAERQMKAAHNPHSKSGRLLRSIKAIKTSEYTRAVGPWLNDKYPLFVEKGRGPVYPKLRGTGSRSHASLLGKHIGAAALRFEIGGKIFFRRRVGPAKPRPYVAPTRKSMKTLFPKIMQKHISEALKK